MDQERFDELAKIAGKITPGAATRRVLAFGGLAALMNKATEKVAEAAGGKKKKGRKNRSKTTSVRTGEVTCAEQDESCQYTPCCGDLTCRDREQGKICNCHGRGEDCERSTQCCDGDICVNGMCTNRCGGEGATCDVDACCCEGGCVNGKCTNTCYPNPDTESCAGNCGKTVKNNCGQPVVCPPCTCVPQCSGRTCGDDGCGGSCGTCPDGQTCNNAEGVCVCVPQDISITCDGNCGQTVPNNCGEPTTCPRCDCKPRCDGRRCGDDHCGGVCGQCPRGNKCQAGICKEGEHCDCPNGKSCKTFKCPGKNGQPGRCAFKRNRKRPGEDGFRCVPSRQSHNGRR